MLLGVLFYFLLVVAFLAMVCLPPLRDRVVAGAVGAWRRARRSGDAWRSGVAQRASQGGASAQGATLRFYATLRRHALPLSAAGVVLVAAPIVAIVLRGSFRVDSFDPSASHEVDERVAALLQGEELVPPPPLPPEFFMTAEVEQWQPLARSASRQWELLDDTFRQRLLLAFRMVHEQYGYDMVLIEGYRSPQRQAALAALGPTVTRAGAGESYHQYGLAADCAFLRDGHIVISEKDPWAMAGYEHYGQVARSLGMVWGGDWRSLRDLGHVELHRPKVPLGGGDNHATDPAAGH